MVTDSLTNHEVPTAPFLIEKDGMVHTTSHLRMWRLTTMNGYQVVSTGIIPRTSGVLPQFHDLC